MAKGFPASTLADSRVADGCRKDGIRSNCTGQRCSTLPPLSNTDLGKDQNQGTKPFVCASNNVHSAAASHWEELELP